MTPIDDCHCRDAHILQIDSFTGSNWSRLFNSATACGMHALKRRPNECIFCFVKSQYEVASFSAGWTSITKTARRYRHSSKTRIRDENLQHRRSTGKEESNTQPHNVSSIKGQFNPRKKALNNRAYEPGAAIRLELNKLNGRVGNDPIFARLGCSPQTLRERYRVFKASLLEVLDAGTYSDKTIQKLVNVCSKSSVESLTLELRSAFYGWMLKENQPSAGIEPQLQALADLRHPQEWFPATRGLQRELHLHVGPTNSGKTYHALKRLEESKSGVYAGPLRLLAHEVYLRLNARGKRCNLITGDDRRTADDDPSAPMASCTVEMVPLNSTVDVAVIDEIQLLGSTSRGWAWTQAVLGVKAKEVHMCGEERAIPIVQQLAALCGDKLHIHRYQRLTPLLTMHTSLEGNLKSLRKGDCVVCFSVASIHAIRQAIEQALGTHCAIIYGSLPPETRVKQAKLFNDQDNDYDILVASNAIGMGLNLSIKRIVFLTSQCYFDHKFQKLPIAEVKQIAGRAGRYSTAEEDLKTDVAATILPAKPKTSVGWVTTLEKIDFPYIEQAMRTDPDPLTSANILPPAAIIERFSKLYPSGTPFSFVLAQIHELARTGTCFRMCDMTDKLLIADAIEPVEGLSVLERLIFCAAPFDLRKPKEAELARVYARLVAENRSATVIDITTLDLELLQPNYPRTREYLSEIIGLHKAVIIFMWLSYRFIGVFLDRTLALHVKEQVEHRIQDTLAQMSFDYEFLRNKAEQALMREEALNRLFGRSETGGDGAKGQTSEPAVHEIERSASVASDAGPTSDISLERKEDGENFEDDEDYSDIMSKGAEADVSTTPSEVSSGSLVEFENEDEGVSVQHERKVDPISS